MRVGAITGYSGAGKTTLIHQLILELVSRGASVAAIKHTHHKLNEENKGDTALFRRAGADPVLLAGEGEAVVFSSGDTRRVRFTTPSDLLTGLTADYVIVEGFKSYVEWPHIEVREDARPTVAEVLERLSW